MCGDPAGGAAGQATRIANATDGQFASGIDATSIAGTIVELVEKRSANQQRAPDRRRRDSAFCHCDYATRWARTIARREGAYARLQGDLHRRDSMPRDRADVQRYLGRESGRRHRGTEACRDQGPAVLAEVCLTI